MEAWRRDPLIFYWLLIAKDRTMEEITWKKTYHPKKENVKKAAGKE